MTHEQFNRTVGVYRTSDLINPPVVDVNSFKLPKNSAYFFTAYRELPISPDAKQSFLVNHKNANIVSVEKYKSPLGNVSKNNTKIEALIREASIKNSEFKFAKSKLTSIATPASKLMIYNYGFMNNLYRYKIDKLNPYYRFRNVLNTAIHDMTGEMPITNRHKYISFRIPPVKIAYSKLERFLKVKNKTLVDTFATGDMLAILELWKLLTPSEFKASVFSKITEEESKDITLLFEIANKIVMVNLHFLISMVKDYKYNSRNTKYSSTSAKKLFLVFLYRTIDTVPSTAEKIGKDRPTMARGLISSRDDVGNKELTDLDIDSILETEIEDTLIDDGDEVLTKEILSKLKASEVPDLDYSDIEEIKQENSDYTTYPVDLIKSNFVDGIITEKEKNKYLELLEEQKYILNKNRIDDKDLKLTNEKIKLPRNNVVEGDSFYGDPISAMDREYINKIYEKDKINTIYSLQNAGVMVLSHEVEKEESILGGFETHRIELKPMNGKKSTIELKIPIIDENGIYKQSGNSYTMRKLRGDQPIRKIKPNRVALSSYYSKLFVTRGLMKKDDIGYYLKKEILKLSALDDDRVKMAVFGELSILDVELPVEFTTLSRNIKSMTVKGIYFNFDYVNRKKLLANPKDIKTIEKNKYILVGKKPKTKLLYLYDKQGTLYVYNGKEYKAVESILDMLEIDMNKMPVEFAVLKVFKENIPIGVLLAYYLGFEKMLNTLKVKHKKVPINERVPKEPDLYVVKFSDYKYIFRRSDKLNSLILGGFVNLSKLLKNVSVNDLNSKESFTLLFNNMGLNHTYVNELNLLDAMYVDPITKNILELMKEPTTFKGLLIRSCELLLTDYVKHSNNLDDMLVKGFDRVPGFMYTSLVDALRVQKNKNTFTKAPVEINSYSVWREMGDDSTSTLVEDWNPIASLKQREDITYIGKYGRSRDVMTKQSREYHPSDVGVVSLATKDSKDVGTAAYMTANPMLNNVRGMKKSYDIDDIEWGNILSTTENLFVASTNDDAKRANFTNIQASHIIGLENSTSFPVRTGYETILPHRVADKFAVTAKANGKVLSVNKNNITVEIDDVKHKYTLGVWTSKEEAGTSYKHEVITNLKKGDSFVSGDAICYDRYFFEPDIFNLKRVVFKSGITLKTMLIESNETYEDSFSMSEKMSKKLAMVTNKIKSFTLPITDEIVNMVKIGDKVTPSSHLFVAMAGGEMSGKIDKETIELLKKLKSRSPKAGVVGKISDIRVMYNAEIEGMSDSLQEITKASDSRLDKFTGKTNASYSIKGIPLTPGNLEIKIYIEVAEGMGLGDKGIFVNQLKATAGDITTYPIVGEDGTEIDAQFSIRSISARIVESPNIIGTTSTLSYAIRDKAVEMYFGE